MLTLFIIIALAVAFYTGVRRGFVLQIIHTVGYIISLGVAHRYYLDLAKRIELLVPYPAPTSESKMVFFETSKFFKLDNIFYASLAFMLIILLGCLVTRLIGMFCHQLTFFPVVKEVNLLGGGILGLLVVYVGLSMMFYFVSTLPLPFIQDGLEKSELAQFMVTKTPYFSRKFVEWWVTSVIK